MTFPKLRPRVNTIRNVSLPCVNDDVAISQKRCPNFSAGFVVLINFSMRSVARPLNGGVSAPVGAVEYNAYTESAWHVEPPEAARQTVATYCGKSDV